MRYFSPCSVIQVLCWIRNNYAAWFVALRNEWRPAYTPSDHGRFLSVFGYAQDRLAGDALVGSECGGSFSEWQHGAHHRLEASIPDPPREGGEPGAVGFDNEEDSPPVARLGLRRLGDGDKRSAGPHQSGR